MSFLHPLAILIGSAALLAPLAVHFLTRPRPKRLPLSTIGFVFEAIQQRRNRYQVTKVKYFRHRQPDTNNHDQEKQPVILGIPLILLVLGN